MSIRQFKKIPTDNREVNKLQTNIELYVKPITDSQIIDGVLLKDVNLTTSVTNKISHKLGRKPLGWLVIRKRADSRIWDTQDSNVGPLQTLYLNCSANVTVDLWIF